MVTKDLLQAELDKIPNEHLEEFYALMQQFVEDKVSALTPGTEMQSNLDERQDNENIGQSTKAPISAHHRFRESGFIGCVKAEADISTTYKAIVKAAIQERFEQSQISDNNQARQ